MTKGIFYKPLGYVCNGWYRVVTPAIPKRVLNLYLQQPRKRIAFRWEEACCLADDEYCVVSIPHPLGVEEEWGKTTEWLAPDCLYLLVSESRKLTWSVSVRQHTGEHPNGQWKGPTASPLSQTWRLSWHPSGDTFTSPLPEPASPPPTPGL